MDGCARRCLHGGHRFGRPSEASLEASAAAAEKQHDAPVTRRRVLRGDRSCEQAVGGVVSSGGGCTSLSISLQKVISLQVVPRA